LINVSEIGNLQVSNHVISPKVSVGDYIIWHFINYEQKLIKDNV